jgi:hypothetical protein
MKPIQIELLATDSRIYYVSPAKILLQARELKHLNLNDAIEKALDSHSGMIGQRRVNMRASIQWILDQEALPAKKLAERIAKRREEQRSSEGFFKELRRVNKFKEE